MSDKKIAYEVPMKWGGNIEEVPYSRKTSKSIWTLHRPWGEGDLVEQRCAIRTEYRLYVFDRAEAIALLIGRFDSEIEHAERQLESLRINRDEAAAKYATSTPTERD